MPRVNFTLSDEDKVHVRKIVQRFIKLTKAKRDPIEFFMDLAACHNGGCPLDLEGLAERADDFTVLHDVVGIEQHLDRTTGKLSNHFLPRTAKGLRT